MDSQRKKNYTSEHLEALISAVPYGIVVYTDDKVVFLNDAMAAMVGVKARNELIGKSIWSYVVPEERDLIKERILEALTKGFSYNAPYHIKRRDGSLITVEASSARVMWGDVPAVQTIIWDITRDVVERNRAEEELQSWMRRYNLIAESSGQVAYEYMIATGQITWGPNVEKVLGYPPREMTGGVQQWEGLLHPEDRKAICEELRSAEKSERYLDTRYRLRHKKGHYIWIRDRGFFVPDAQGKAYCQLGMLEDVTIAKEAEEALRKSEERYRSIFENALEGIFQTTPGGRYINVNPAFARMLGFASPAELISAVTDIGKQIYVNQEDRIQLKRLLSEHGYVERFQAQVRRRDGEAIWISINARVVKDDTGTVLYYEGTNVDITEYKKAREALAKSEQHFQDLVLHVPDFIAVLRDLKFLYANDSALRTLKISSLSELRERSLLDFIISKEDKERAIKRVEEVIHSGRPNKPQGYVFKNAEGGSFYFEGSSSPCKWDGQDAIVVIARDMTMEKQLLDGLQESEQKYRSLVDGCVDGLVVHAHRRILYANPATCQLSGYGFEEIIAKLFSSLFDVDEEIIEERGAHVLSKKQKGVFNKFRDFSLIHKSGQRVEVEVCDAAIDWGGGKAILSFIRDKSERIRADKERLRFIKELEEKTIALEQKSIDLQDIINGVEEEKNKVARKVDARIRNDILPIVKRLHLKGASSKYVQILTDRLQELTIGPDKAEIAKLSPQEREVCNLIRQGLTSKQIAELLSISSRTADRHRDNIRKKLNIKNMSLAAWLSDHLS